MSKGIEKPTFQELLNDLQSIVEIPDRINVIDIIRLKELNNQLDKMISEKWKFINNILTANHNHEHPRMRNIEHWKNNALQYGFSYNSLSSLKEIIQKRIVELQETDNSNQFKNDNKHADIFKDNGFEILREWLKISKKDEPIKKVSYIFQKLKSLNKIRNSNSKNFMLWLKENNFIDADTYSTLYENGFVSPNNIVNGHKRNDLFDTINLNK
jgi:hypothetical protein